MDRKTGFDYRVPVLFAFCLLTITISLALYTSNNELGTPNQTTNACELNQSLVSNNVYYDNESKVCWNPENNDINLSNESENISE